MKHTHFITKPITVSEMTRAQYNEYRGWLLPDNENGDDQGYLVEYCFTFSNHDNHEGYIAWMPKELVDTLIQPMENLAFEEAWKALKQGKTIARSGWNGKNMHAQLTSVRMECEDVPVLMLTKPDGKPQLGWLPSVGDLLADDWSVL